VCLCCTFTHLSPDSLTRQVEKLSAPSCSASEHQHLLLLVLRVWEAERVHRGHRGPNGVIAVLAGSFSSTTTAFISPPKKPRPSSAPTSSSDCCSPGGRPNSHRLSSSFVTWVFGPRVGGVKMKGEIDDHRIGSVSTSAGRCVGFTRHPFMWPVHTDVLTSESHLSWFPLIVCQPLTMPPHLFNGIH